MPPVPLTRHFRLITDAYQKDDLPLGELWLGSSRSEKKRGFFGWFNRKFDAMTLGYERGVGRHPQQRAWLRGVPDYCCGNDLHVHPHSYIVPTR